MDPAVKSQNDYILYFLFARLLWDNVN